MRLVLAAALLLSAALAAQAAALRLSLAPDPANPSVLRMGDRVAFRGTIANAGSDPAHGVVAWITLVRVDPGREQPVDLEDWSAHKALARAVMAPGERTDVQWPMRLIQSGHYRVAVSAAENGSASIVSSPFVDFRVERKPVVESRRVLPVALGVPIALALVLLWVRARTRPR